MSQRIVIYHDLEALTGWDRPLQHFFLVIEKQNATDEDGYVFNNLARPNAAMTLEEIEQQLDKAGVPVPPTLIEDLQLDCDLNRGNHRITYAWEDTTYGQPRSDPC